VTKENAGVVCTYDSSTPMIEKNMGKVMAYNSSKPVIKENTGNIEVYDWYGKGNHHDTA